MKSKLKEYSDFIRRQKYPFRTVLSTLLLKSRLNRLVKVHVRGYKLHFHPASLSRLMWVDPHIRDHDLDLLKAYLKPGDFFIDVGANVGFTALEASLAVRSNGRVYAFEPHPKIFKFLSQNIALNQRGNIQSFNLALGSKSGTLSFLDSKADDRNYPSEKGSIEVKVKTLDSVLERPGQIDLLKIDVEGYEKFVLEGATETLSRTQGIYFEACENFTQRAGYSSTELLRFVQASGFKLLKVDHQLRTELLPEDFELESGQIVDLLAVRDVKQLESRLKGNFAKEKAYIDARH